MVNFEELFFQPWQVAQYYQFYYFGHIFYVPSMVSHWDFYMMGGGYSPPMGMGIVPENFATP